MFSLIAGLFLGAVSVMFALQNIFPVTVTFLAWDMTASLALIVSIAVLVGFVVAILFTLPESIKNYFAISKLQKENRKLEDKLEATTQKEVAVETASPEEPKTL